MKAIINQEELLEPLARRILIQYYKHKQVDYSNVYQYLQKLSKQFVKTGLLNIDFGHVNSELFASLTKHTDWLVSDYKSKYRPLTNWLEHSNLDIDPKILLNWYSLSSHRGFTKTLASTITANFECITSTNDDFCSDVLIRNVIHNERSIAQRLSAGSDFWFTDTGYTNFLVHKGKPWHRLVRNHVHTNLSHLNFPANRLALLPSMPAPWRTTGHKVLVVESSDNHYQMFGTDRNSWRDSISNDLAKYTDKPVEYRSKSLNKKTRDSVYNLLMSSNDYYCVISDSSAAAVEAIWAGVPVITLNKHITVPVARTQIADINNLYRGPIGDWLCALSYSQFTKKEMLDGTAYRIIEKYHV
jgi:hypothetical protein